MVLHSDPMVLQLYYIPMIEQYRWWYTAGWWSGYAGTAPDPSVHPTATINYQMHLQELEM